MTVNVALIGYGLAGASFHAPLIAAEPRLRIARVITSRADAVAQAFPEAVVSTDTDSALAPDIDLVVIATPNATHVPLARDAVLAGKHVVVDKPFALDPDEGADLAALAHERGRMLTVFHNRRWDGDFQTVARLVAEGQLGEIMLAQFNWDRFRPDIREGWKEAPEQGGGLLADLGPHMIDQTLLLFGPPDTIEADIALQRPGTLIDDYFQLTLRYGARRVILSCSTLVAAARPRFALHGTRGSFVKYGIDPQEAVLRAGGGPRDPAYGVEAPEYRGVLTAADGSRSIETDRGDWSRFYVGVADAVIDGAPPPVDPRDAVTGLSIIECAERSAREGRSLRFSPPGAR